MPDLHFLEFGQCFPRYAYPPPPPPPEEQGEGLLDEGEAELVPVDNITDSALAKFQSHYGDGKITKDAIFDYVYGVLHAPEYRERFANDLTKELPRVPMAPDFHAFAEAGAKLADLHLNYESCERHPLEVIPASGTTPAPEDFRLGTSRMKLLSGTGENDQLKINQVVTLSGIPAEAHQYEVNGRTPLGWFIDRYRITTDKHSGIVNDPNAWFDDPRDLVAAIERIIHVSIQTVAIVNRLPDPFGE